MYVTFEDQIARIVHSSCPTLAVDIQYARLEFKHGQIVMKEEWEKHLMTLARGVLSEYMSRIPPYNQMILDDPYKPTTPEQQEKLKEWYEKWKEREKEDGSG